MLLLSSLSNHRGRYRLASDRHLIQGVIVAGRLEADSAQPLERT
ncbi:Uncharacterized protein YR821_0003 [Yersinia ruckeri]|uniref:Uncharacterized protein n=1 Tax=Yersinia ruckeri TaxID=29486 RepID=A0A0A8VBX6_YERRU|nr:hypothetical protein yruck0001_29270 [Yersinia ruckeri ATCC 29473]QTD74936.1 Uncharacterized protein YR821_0003 [Yersinia ruckeri]CEK25838.1 hypothetical protein CSF007_0215 [Yersinia ruckeri]